MTWFLTAVRHEVNNLESSVVVQEPEFAINRVLYDLLWSLGNQYIVGSLAWRSLTHTENFRAKPAPPIAVLTFSRPTKTATPATKPTATIQLPAPKPAPAEKRPAHSPDADDTRPTQQQRRVSPTVTAINDQPPTSTAATTNNEKFDVPSYDSFHTRPREVGKPYRLDDKYKFWKTFWIERQDDGEQIVIVQKGKQKSPGRATSRSRS